MTKKSPYQAYEENLGSQELKQYTKELSDYAKDNNIEIEPSETKLKHMLKTDVRDAIPPQVYRLIGIISESIESSKSNKS